MANFTFFFSFHFLHVPLSPCPTLRRLPPPPEWKRLEMVKARVPAPIMPQRASQGKALEGQASRGAGASPSLHNPPQMKDEHKYELLPELSLPQWGVVLFHASLPLLCASARAFGNEHDMPYSTMTLTLLLLPSFLFGGFKKQNMTRNGACCGRTVNLLHSGESSRNLHYSLGKKKDGGSGHEALFSAGRSMPISVSVSHKWAPPFSVPLSRFTVIYETESNNCSSSETWDHETQRHIIVHRAADSYGPIHHQFFLIRRCSE